jgi:hypothetical protein
MLKVDMRIEQRFIERNFLSKIAIRRNKEKFKVNENISHQFILSTGLVGYQSQKLFNEFGTSYEC